MEILDKMSLKEFKEKLNEKNSKKNLAKKLTLLPTNKTLGARGEQEAVNYLIKKGYKVPVKNWKIPYGEVDLIAIHKDLLIFIEVKSRFDSPIARKHLFDNITERKKYKLRTLASIFTENHWKGKSKPKYRIDIVGVLFDKEDASLKKIIHLEGAL